MCGRSGLSLDREAVRCACAYKPKGKDVYLKPEWSPEHNDGKEYVPSYNIAPTDVTPVLISGKRNVSTKAERILKPMMWGVIPPWHQGDYKTHKLSTNNCRLEDLKSSKLYGPLLRNGGRCVIVVEGFYEWQTTNKMTKVKQPYYIYAQQTDDTKVDDPQTWKNNFSEENGWNGVKLLSMAGLYNTWQHQDIIIYSYTVITMESNSTMDWLHHRMPAILDSEQQIQAWLDVDEVPPELALTYLNPTQLISWHPVATIVNNSRNKSADCNKQIALVKNKFSQKTLTSWFQKDKKKCDEENEPAAKKGKTEKKE